MATLSHNDNDIDKNDNDTDRYIDKCNDINDDNS